ncbi:hypothetical protein EV183_004306 [Coemansia sp. RSA 2336]|nr:hypothetical protein EV183_004306 [Coemansia sp. RSA 2336]
MVSYIALASSALALVACVSAMGDSNPLYAREVHEVDGHVKRCGCGHGWGWGSGCGCGGFGCGRCRGFW